MLMVTEPERLELHQAMRGFIGTGPANTFMQLATPRDWDDIVRVHQLDSAIDDLRAELKSDISDVRMEIADLRTGVRTGFAEVRTEMTGLRADMTGLLSSEIRRQTQWIIGVLTSLSIALIVATVL
ncbi:MAG: hypothetical protein RLZZ526_1562 [Actinomycetota bacterium]|jgi:hypothetical protein